MTMVEEIKRKYAKELERAQRPASWCNWHGDHWRYWRRLEDGKVVETDSCGIPLDEAWHGNA